MLLGLVAACEAEEQHLVGLASAAVRRGWQIRCFLTDRGVLLARSATLLKLAVSGDIQLTVCEHSWAMYGSGSVAAGVSLGSQYQNAELAHVCDRVIVL